MDEKNISDEVKAAAASLGRKGGRMGTGDAKKRSPAHYVMLGKKRRGAAMRKKMEKLDEK